jgi:hypothetical protein
MVMRMGTWDKQLPGHHGRNRSKARLKRGTRRARIHLTELEGLESRTLLATIPAATAAGGPQNLSSLVGNVGGTNASQNSSTVVIDPTNPTKLVSVWIDNDPTMAADTDNEFQIVLEAAYSVNSGQSWLPLLGEPIGAFNSAPIVFDPSTSNPTVPYIDDTNPSLGFDQSGNFYILSEYHDASSGTGGSTSGALVLQKFNFNGSTPAAVTFANNVQTPDPFGGGFGFGGGSDYKIVYQWDGAATDEAIDPTMTVDNNLATVPTGVVSEADTFSGNVYVSWTSIDVNTAVPIAGFNAIRI